MSRNREVSILLAIVLLCSAATAQERISDSAITRSIEDAFQRESRLRKAEIDVSSMRGMVTLKGEVDSYFDKHRAEQLARGVRGVTQVTSMLRVSSPLRGDGEIAADIKRRFSQSSYLRGDAIDVTVTGGMVTLTGDVSTYSASRQAQTVAGEVRGVRMVRNDLAVSSIADRGDNRIKAEVEAALGRDNYLAEFPITVAVTSGRVTLTGEVNTLFQRDHAVEQTQLVTGVLTVDNRLEVASRTDIRRELGEPSDEELAELVFDELDADPRIDANEIMTRANRGAVLLAGTVGSMFERQTAERVARTVFGVMRVDNKLQVNAADRADAEILDDIWFNVRSDARLSTYSIEASVTNGHVTLVGNVPDPIARQRVAQLTSRVRGVREINNRLMSQ